MRSSGEVPGRTHRFLPPASDLVVFPFGHGMSYTTFTYALHHAPSAARALSLAPLRALLAAAAAAGRSFVRSDDLAALAPLVSYAINVTNTGEVDSDDVLLGFVTPPGAGKGGAPLKTLFGFERVHVKAGETVTVWLYPAATDFAHVDVDGVRHAQAGEYTLCFGVQEAARHGTGFVRHRLVAE